MIVEITAVPNSKKFSVWSKDGRVKVSLRSPPENNRANLELERELSALLGAEVRIISGHSSKRKKLAIATSSEAWAAFLSGLQPL